MAKIKMNQGYGRTVNLKTKIANHLPLSNDQLFEIDKLPKLIKVTATGSENIYFDYLNKLGYLCHGYTKVQ